MVRHRPFSAPPRRSWRTQLLIAQSSNKRAMQRATSQNSHVFISRLPIYWPTSQPQLANFSPPCRVLPKFCPRTSSLEPKEPMLSRGDTIMYTFLTSTQVTLIGPFPLSCAFQSIQIPPRDGRLPLPSAVCYTVSGTLILTYPLRPSTLIDAPMDLNL